jgi:hypothetical protein
VLPACARRSSAQEDSSYSWDAAAGTRTPTPIVAQGACTDLADCERSCEAGKAEECRRLGDTLALAVDGGKDETRATAYYVRACGMESAPACLAAGHMYEYQRGVAKDETKAAGFYQRGCEQGYVPSCVNYAIMLENGRGVTKDVLAANRLYGEACHAGAGLACDRAHALSPEGGPTGTPPPP